MKFRSLFRSVFKNLNGFLGVWIMKLKSRLRVKRRLRIKRMMRVWLMIFGWRKMKGKWN